MADEMIVRNTDVLAGKPVIRGTRISVEFILDLLADGWSVEDVLQSYPHLSKEQITACLHYARDLLQSENVSPAA